MTNLMIEKVKPIFIVGIVRPRSKNPTEIFLCLEFRAGVVPGAGQNFAGVLNIVWPAQRDLKRDRRTRPCVGQDIRVASLNISHCTRYSR
ncbi:MAG: hypothetical protein P1U69_03270 [Parvibaculaceae bacterium]|nr:hypothetical protein [Parvibaculaceae bacterium]